MFILSNKQLVLVMGGIAIVAFAGAAYYWVLFQSPKHDVAQEAVVPESNPPVLKTPKLEPVPRPVISSDQEAVERLARIVVQRVGTFSPGDVSGLESLRPIFSPEVFNALFHAREQALLHDDSGVTARTNAIAMEQSSADAQKGSVVATGQQQRMSAQGNTSKELRVSLSFEKDKANNWIVTNFDIR